MNRFTAEQIQKLFDPTGELDDSQYQVDVEIANETFITVLVNCECAIIIETGVWSGFTTKKKSFVVSELGLKAREAKLYAWIAKELNTHLEGAEPADVEVFLIERKLVNMKSLMKKR